jgi:hypothetical protein
MSVLHLLLAGCLVLAGVLLQLLRPALLLLSMGSPPVELLLLLLLLTRTMMMMRHGQTGCGKICR